MTLLEELESTIGVAVERHGPAVVGLGRGWNVGSGVVIATNRVVTNAHNLRHDETTITFNDGRRAAGRVLGVDPDLDLAVIEVDAAGTEPVPWGAEEDQAEPPRIGTAVLALANPGGRGLRVTPGFVSATARSFRGPRGRRIAGAIEHTAPLPRGSSGGPLIDTGGRLLGFNSVRVDGGLILAIPSDRAVRSSVEAMARGEAPRRIRLGVALAPSRAARRMRRAVGLPERDGLLVRAVEGESPAGRAGIERGDLLVAADGRPIEGIDALYEALDRAKDRGRLELSVVRGSDERTVAVSF
jgi:serine protease Do